MVLKMKGVQVNTIAEDIIEEEGGEGQVGGGLKSYSLFASANLNMYCLEL